MKNKKEKKSQKTRIKEVRPYIVTIITCVLLYISLKYFASYLILSSLKNVINQPARSKFEIENIDFEPLTLKLIVKNLNFDKGEPSGQISIDFAFPNFLKRRIHIYHIQLNGLRENIVKNGDEYSLDKITKSNASIDKKTTTTNWQISVDKVEIMDSTFILNNENKIELNKVEIHGFDTQKRENFTNFSLNALINKSAINLDGKFNQSSLSANFDLDHFELEILNLFVDKDKTGIGKIVGKISTQGQVSLEDNLVKLNANLTLEDTFIYSKDLAILNYFVKELYVQNLSVNDSSSLIKVESGAVNINNLLLSVPADKFDIDTLSKFENIRINNINVSKSKTKTATKGIIHFSNGGFAAVNNFKAGNQDIVDVKINSVDLTQFSASFEPLLNYQIQSGRMSLDSRTFVSKESLKGSVKVNLAQISLDDQNELGQDIQNQSTIPFKTALSMIKDYNGNFDMEFKISGKKDDPNFNILGMLGKGMGSLVVSKISAMVAERLAVKFVPLLVSSLPMSPGNVFMFTNGAYKMITKPRFKDIDFIALKSEIDTKSHAELNDIIAFLKENKKVKLRICPVASKAEFNDKKTDDVKVLTLANKRVESVEKYFKNNNHSNILKQIIFCRPKISDGGEGSKAEISL